MKVSLEILDGYYQIKFVPESESDKIIAYALGHLVDRYTAGEKWAVQTDYDTNSRYALYGSFDGCKVATVTLAKKAVLV